MKSAAMMISKPKFENFDSDWDPDPDPGPPPLRQEVPMEEIVVVIQPVVVLPSPGEVVVVAVAVAVEEPIELAAEAVEEVVVIIVVVEADTKVMDRHVAPKTASSTQDLIPTVGLVGMMLEKDMIAQHVTSKHMAIKIHQQLLIQKEVL
jgi:hypothetical protein